MIKILHIGVATDFAKLHMKMLEKWVNYMLAFGQPETWSLKYNLVWDKRTGEGFVEASGRLSGEYKQPRSVWRLLQNGDGNT